MAVITFIKYLDERNKSKIAPTTEQLDSLLKSTQQMTGNIKEYQQILFHADTSVKRVKIVK